MMERWHESCLPYNAIRGAHIGGNTMHWMIRRARSTLLLMPALAFAIPAYAEPRELELNDSQVPGSVIVFPKFIQGTVTLSGGGTAPKTEIEIGIVSPEGEPCAEHEPVKLLFHWVCPG